jgi:hypothetical protein
MKSSNDANATLRYVANAHGMIVLNGCYLLFSDIHVVGVALLEFRALLSGV